MAKRKIKNIVWALNAANEFDEIMEFLSEKSQQAANIVGTAILDTIGSLAIEYDHHPSDRLKNNNDNTFKAAIVYSYRISYHISATEVNILRIRHTSREPLSY